MPLLSLPKKLRPTHGPIGGMGRLLCVVFTIASAYSGLKVGQVSRSNRLSS